MGNTLRELSPNALWNNFADLNAVPRPSKKEERVIGFMMNFGKSLGLPVYKDDMGNVIIKKPASAGLENRVTVSLQGHLDMVHQKNAGTDFDFSSQGIDMFVEGDWVRARGTTLGADNGIGVAAIMSVLAANDIVHPAIEALFTIDEETGMSGALGLKGGLLEASIMLNLDTEDDNELTIGCAGGVDVTAMGTYEMTDQTEVTTGWRLTLSGLTGGHSGMDIHKGRANANKLINRVLLAAVKEFGIQISLIDGGGLRNAIPRESVAEFVLAKINEEEFKQFIRLEEKVLKDEYQTTDPNLSLAIESCPVSGKVMSDSFSYRFLRSIYACPNGIYRMSPEIPGLVQTSNNLARVLVKDGAFSVLCLTRSAVDSEKADLAKAVQSSFELCAASVEFGGDYPGWTPWPDAPIVQLMSQLYKEKHGEDALVNACHAGLECGIIGANYPHTQMISFGPNIRGAHSPDEKVQISSVQKFWDFLLETLKRVPEKPGKSRND